jgi:manganese/zinc/iron transport system permease protein
VETEERSIGNFTLEEIIKVRPISPFTLQLVLKEVRREGLIQHNEDMKLTLTEKGLQQSHNIVLKNRLQDMYLMHESKFPISNWREGSMDLLEGPKEIVDELLALLKEFGREPKALYIYEKQRKKLKPSFQSHVKGSASHL